MTVAIAPAKASAAERVWRRHGSPFSVHDRSTWEARSYRLDDQSGWESDHWPC